jgi:hypothetical protein
MPQHSNGKAMSQPSARNMWRPASESWSANRAEHRFADGYELVTFDLACAKQLSGHNRLGTVRRT